MLGRPSCVFVRVAGLAWAGDFEALTLRWRDEPEGVRTNVDIGDGLLDGGHMA